ncbi:MAG: hypothetical protein QOF62_146 [Pyrinomonadaceae bacterium]|jgi:hypothetical protein|nr:hypothetical protein [Pyrinomonadaceae bacterium]
MSAIFFLEFKYLRSDWAGLPSFFFTLPLSVIVVAIGFLAEPTAARFSREIVITDYFFEYGFMICAFLNAFLFYPIYLLRKNRQRQDVPLSPPPPPNKSLDASGGGASRN